MLIVMFVGTSVKCCMRQIKWILSVFVDQIIMADEINNFMYVLLSLRGEVTWGEVEAEEGEHPTLTPLG